MAECYAHGRGCERDLAKAADLGNSEAALELGMNFEKEGREIECVRYLWIASDLVEVEASAHLAEIYKHGKMVEMDEEESKRLLSIATEGVDYQQADGFEWGVNQKEKILFIKGGSIERDERGSLLWDEHKGSIEWVFISSGTEAIKEMIFKGFSVLERISLPSSVMSIGETSFLDCHLLQSIFVSSSNQSFSSKRASYLTKTLPSSFHIPHQRVCFVKYRMES